MPGAFGRRFDTVINSVADDTGQRIADHLDHLAIEFDVAGADGASRVLFYERGDDQARWLLG